MPSLFIKSAEKLEDCPESSLPEVGIVGRSNSGKSSLINALTNRKGLAHVSAAPGKTQILNFFEVDKKYMLVDMPGYGYAARSQEMRLDWQPMIENYLQSREQLRGVILVLDIKRQWSKDEASLLKWLEQNSLAVLIVLNKVDKLNKKELDAKKQYFVAKLKGVEVVFISARSSLGIDKLNRSIFENLLRT